MSNRFFVAAAFAFVLLAPAASAEDLGAGGWGDDNQSSNLNNSDNRAVSPVNGSVQPVQTSVSGQGGDVSHVTGRTDSQNFYLPAVTPGGYANSARHFTSYTKNQSVLLPTQTVSSGTVIPGTHISPGSLALQNEYGHGGELPPTVLDSFAYRLGMPDRIFGREWTVGPPADSTYGTIDSGGRLHLTTGHHDPSLGSSHSDL